MPQLTQQESRALAQHIVEALMAKLTDKRTVDALVAVWGKQLDQWIGRGFRRLAFYVICIAVVMGAVKLQVWNYMFK